MKFLNISIPVYKRPEKLKELFESVVAQKRNDITISVHDDSEDSYLDNFHLVQSYSNLLDIRYEKNNENLGIDKNIAKCFEKSCARYTLVVGEDDLILPGGIEEIVNILKQMEPKFLFLKYSYFNGNKDINWSQSMAATTKTDKFLEEYIDKLGFIGSFIIETSKFNMQIFADKNTYFNHVGCLLIGLDDLSEIQSTHGNVIRNRVGDLDTFSWKNEALKVFSGFDLMLELVEKRGCKKINIKMLRKLAKNKFNPYIFRRLIKLKAQDVIDNKNIFELFVDGKVMPTGLIALIIPKKICKLIYNYKAKKMWKEI